MCGPWGAAFEPGQGLVVRSNHVAPRLQSHSLRKHSLEEEREGGETKRESRRGEERPREREQDRGKRRDQERESWREGGGETMKEREERPGEREPGERLEEKERQK